MPQEKITIHLKEPIITSTHHIEKLEFTFGTGDTKTHSLFTNNEWATADWVEILNQISRLLKDQLQINKN